MRRTLLMLLVVGGAMLPCSFARAELTDPAMLMPADATVFVDIDTPAIKARQERTLLWQLSKDPAMQPFMASAREGLAKVLREASEEFAATTGTELPEEIPWPLGRIAAAAKVTLIEVTRQMPAFGPGAPGLYGPGGEFGFDGDLQFDDATGPGMYEGGGGTYTTTTPFLEGVLVVDFGANLDAFRQLERKLVAAAVDDGAVQRGGESYRGVDITILTSDDADETFGGLCAYAYKGSVLVLGNNLDMVRHVLSRMDGAPAPSLGETEGCRAMARSLDAGQVFVYADVQRLIADLTDKTRRENPQVDTILRAMGADGLRQAGMAIEIAPDPLIQSRYRLRLTVDGPKRGIVKLLTPATRPIRMPPFTTGPETSLIVANYELGEIFDQVNTLATALGNAPLGVIAQHYLAATGGGGRPPVSLRNDVLARLAPPIVLRSITTVDDTGTGLDGKMVLSVAARDAAGLNEAIGRIHGTFVPTPQARRELLGSMLYLLEPGEDVVYALTVAGDAVVLGPTDELEAAIMSLRADEPPTLETDPLFRHARRFLPAEAGIWAYEDDQRSVGDYWDPLRRAAADGQTIDDDFENMAVFSPLQMLVDALEEVVDFRLLPEFRRVRKYFGAETCYLIGTDDGFYAESVFVAPPGEGE